jgi:hypothetical protein
VKRWRGGKMILRWTVAAVADAATRFRRVTGAREGMTVEPNARAINFTKPVARGAEKRSKMNGTSGSM